MISDSIFNSSLFVMMDSSSFRGLGTNTMFPSCNTIQTANRRVCKSSPTTPVCVRKWTRISYYYKNMMYAYYIWKYDR